MCFWDGWDFILNCRFQNEAEVMVYFRMQVELSAVTSVSLTRNSDFDLEVDIFFRGRRKGENSVEIFCSRTEVVNGSNWV